MGKHKLIAAEGTLKPKKKISLKILIPVIVVFIMVCLVASWGITCIVSAYKLLNPGRKGLLLDDGPMELDMVYRTFDLPGVNSGDQLICWWIPSQDYMAEEVPSDKTVILSHNYGSNREMIEISAVYLVDYIVHEGYNVVMFDYSGSGNAEGANYTFGDEEAVELGLVADYVKENFDQEDIAVLGWGFGAAAAIVAGSENDNISCIIADGSYLDLKSYLSENLSVWSYLPDFLFTDTIIALMEKISGCDFQNSPYEAVGKASGKNFLFLHGIDDYVFPYENSNILYERAAVNNFSDVALFKTLHIYGFMDYEENYTNEILNFLENHLGVLSDSGFDE